MENPDYPYRYELSYGDKNGKPIQFTILCKEKQSYNHLHYIFSVEFQDYINEHKSVKLSKNNIIKYLNNNGVECVNRAYYKNNKK
jgi:hypothetical protein